MLSSMQEGMAELVNYSEEEKKQGAEAQAALILAQSYLSELATHLAAGIEVLEALRKTQRGELPLTAEQFAQISDGLKKATQYN